MIDWTVRLARLADQLHAAGDLRTPAWREAFCAVPRHLLVPRFYEPDGSGRWRPVDSADPGQRDRWLEAVYSNTTLVTALAEIPLPAEWGGGSHQVPVSSTTLPGLMIRMLEDLKVTDGHTVLEIGTGTGYNTALLCVRLGDPRVSSIDVRPELITEATDRLATLGYRPDLATLDGAAGYPQRAPYDRIIATCATRYVPPAWIDQLKPGGMMLLDLEGATAAGNLATLWRTGNAPVVHGRFCHRRASFMPMTHQPDPPPADPIPRTGDQPQPTERTTTIGPDVLHHRHQVAAYLIQLHLPAGTSLQRTDHDTTRLVVTDGSVAEVTDQPDRHGRYRLLQTGSVPLWERVEHAVAIVEQLGSPTWEQFGITATPAHQYMWYDRPDSPHRWPLDTDGPL